MMGGRCGLLGDAGDQADRAGLHRRVIRGNALRVEERLVYKMGFSVAGFVREISLVEATRRGKVVVADRSG